MFHDHTALFRHCFYPDHNAVELARKDVDLPSSSAPTICILQSWRTRRGICDSSFVEVAMVLRNQAPSFTKPQTCECPSHTYILSHSFVVFGWEHSSLVTYNFEVRLHQSDPELVEPSDNSSYPTFAYLLHRLYCAHKNILRTSTTYNCVETITSLDY